MPSVFQQDALEWTYGRQNELVLTLYPMSMADQLKISDVITDVLTEVVQTASDIKDGTTTDFAFISALANTLQTNFVTVASIVSGKPESDEVIVDLPNHVTNMQLMAFAEYVWETNYGAVRKNYDSLFDLLKKLQTPTTKK